MHACRCTSRRAPTEGKGRGSNGSLQLAGVSLLWGNSVCQTTRLRGNLVIWFSESTA